MNITIRNYEQKDWENFKEIYSEGIKTGNATFETSPPSREKWEENHLEVCRLAVVFKNKVIGWAALSPVSQREIYAGVAEVSIYISMSHTGKGIGKMLMTKLIAESEANGIWTLEAGIFPENTASINLHKSCGFRLVGIREKIGKMNGIWRNTLLLERRSKVSGI